VLGTVFNPPSAARSYVKLEGPQGARVLSIDWVRGRVTGTEPIPEAGFATRFVPDGSGKLARYDLWTNRVVRI